MHDESSPRELLSLTRHLRTEADTSMLGEVLGLALQPGTVIHLHGELGAGKTTLARGVLRGLGYTGRVKSPTYTLVELYKVSRLYLYHFDFYRLEKPNDWIDAGFEEYFRADAACLVEWPEHAGTRLPRADLDVRLSIRTDGRDVELVAQSELGRCLIRSAAPQRGSSMT